MGELHARTEFCMLRRGVDAGLGQLDAVAFARGPGAFTGLRTACASAQGLAFGIGCGVLVFGAIMVAGAPTMRPLQRLSSMIY